MQAALYKVRIDNRSLYDLKLHIIQRNLHGVDNDEFAVNIAMLRMWLSISIEYEGPTPEPLPNLDFKVVLGDSILGPDPSPENYGDLFRNHVHSIAGRLSALKKEYMSAQGQGKKDMKEQVEDVERELREALTESRAEVGAVDWRVQFAEVFDRGGFDVALANPPYIQLQKNQGELRKWYQDKGFKSFTPSGDVYQLFYERGCQMLTRSRGVLAYITSNSWLRAQYGRNLRNYFAERHTPLRLLDLGKDVFESAIVDSSVLLLREGAGGGTFPAVDMDMMSTPDFPPHETLWGRVRPDGSGPWSILTSVEESVMDKVGSLGTTLEQWDVRINFGVKTGYNKAFIIDDAKREALIAQDPRSDDIIKPVLRGRDIQRYKARRASRWLIDTHNGYSNVAAIDIDDYPAIKTYLDQFSDQLEKRDKGRTPYNLRSCAYYEEFSKDKLLWLDLVKDGRFAFDEEGIYPEASTFFMTGEHLKYLCALLNSKLARWFLQHKAPTSGMGVLRWKKVYVQTIPITKISAAKQLPFVRLVDQILTAKNTYPNAETGELERQIDELVYELYCLTETEVEAVEHSLVAGR